MDLDDLSLRDLTGVTTSRTIQVVEIVEGALRRAQELVASTNPFALLDPEQAFLQAQRLDDRLSRGEDAGPLVGVPVAVKDLHHAKGFATGWGSAALADGRPASYDTPLVAALRRAGCVVLGKTTTSELGWKPVTDSPATGVTTHPSRADRSPGGSSGGSAAALVGGAVLIATGTDGGGSVRIPAALCGLPGLKPSAGSLPVDPVAPLWPDLSVDAPMTRSIEDLLYVLRSLQVDAPAGDFRLCPAADLSAAARRVQTLTIAWSPTLGYATPDPSVLGVCERALAAWSMSGAEVVEVADVIEEDPLPAWLRITAAHNCARLRHLEGTEQWERIDPGLREQIGHAQKWPVADYADAELTRYKLARSVAHVFDRADLLVAPTLAVRDVHLDGRAELNGDLTERWVQYTYPFNLTGNPAATVPLRDSADSRPAALQIIGPNRADQRVISAATRLLEALA